MLVWCSSPEAPVKILSFVSQFWPELMAPIEDLLGGGGGGGGVTQWTKRFSWTGRLASCSAVLALTTRLLQPIFNQQNTDEQPPLALEQEQQQQQQQQQQEQTCVNEVLTLQARALVGLLVLTGDLLTLQQQQQQPPQSQPQQLPQRTSTSTNPSPSPSLGQRFDPTLLLFPLGGGVITTRRHNNYVVLPTVLSTITALPLPQLARALLSLMVLITRNDYYVQNSVTEQINTMKMVAKKDLVVFVEGISNRVQSLGEGSGLGKGRREHVSMGKRGRDEAMGVGQGEEQGLGQGLGQGQGSIHQKDVDLINESCRLLLDGVQSSIEHGLF